MNKMKITHITLIIICILCIFILIYPVLFLKATEPVLNPQIREDLGVFFIDFSSLTGRFNTAADISGYIISLNPSSPEFYIKKAEYLIESGDFNGALVVIDEAVKIDPSNIYALLLKARLHRSIGQLQISESVYQQIEKIVPASQHDLIMSGDADLERGNYFDAFRRYTEAINKNPSDGTTQEKRGDVIFALLTIPTAGLTADNNTRNLDLKSEGLNSYKAALSLMPSRNNEISDKISRLSDIYMPESINELQSRYLEYKYLK